MTSRAAVAIELDALGDTRALWSDWLASASGFLGVAPDELPSDRGAAADELDGVGAGNWRALLERFCEDRVPVYVRRDAATTAALRGLAASGRRVGVFTDAPEPLARVALTHVGARRRIASFESGSGALDRLLAALGDNAEVVRTRQELLELAT